jgi:hypothetical protein
MKHTKHIDFRTGKEFLPGNPRYYEAKIGPIIVFLSRRHSHIMWGDIPTGLIFKRLGVK